MEGTLRPRVKVCCISSIEEANLAIRHGADALGLVGPMPSGPGIISNDMIQQIQRTVPPPIATFLLTSESSSKKIIEHHKKVNTSAIQIVDELKEGVYEDIRAALPQIKLIQVIHVIDENSIEEAIKISKQVDAILLDSGNPNLKVKELGGTGRVHNWDLSTRIREAIDIPLFLAGGLNANNVQSAIKKVQPFGLDLCSGVRTNGELDEKKLVTFFKTIKGLFI